MTVKLYKYAAENIRANKGPLLTNETSFNADLGFEGNQNVETPSIIIQSAAEPAFNYAYIDGFKRYYYITAKTWLSKDLWRLTLAVDPLYTFYSGILQQSGTVLYSGKGNIKKYDPRVVYNDVPEKIEIAAVPNYLQPADGGTIWIVLGCKYFYHHKFLDLFDDKMNNAMSYIAFSPAAYSGFLSEISDPRADPEWRERISKTIVFATLVRYLHLTKETIPRWDTQQINTGAYDELVYFSSPEIYVHHPYGEYPEGSGVLTYDTYEEQPDPLPPVFQFTNEQIKDPYRVYFMDSAKDYAERKAQRIIELPYIGDINIDLDNLGMPLSITEFWLGVEIRYDFGGNEYIVTPLYANAAGHTSPYPNEKDIVYCRDSMLNIPNNYQIGFVTDDSHQYETETMTAQLLGLISTAAMGVITGIATDGATIPATAASLGVGIANMQLTESKLQYQEAASLVQKGSSNGGSAYDTLLTKYLGDLVRPRAKLFKKVNRSATDLTAFSEMYGKPDGAFRALSSLVGTGYTQMGSIVLNGFEAATNNEKNMIRDALLSGVIL